MSERDTLMELDIFISKTNRRLNFLEKEIAKTWLPQLKQTKKGEKNGKTKLR